MIVNQKSINSLRIITDLIVLNLVFILSAALAQPWEVFLSKPYLIILMILESLLWLIGGNLFKLYADFHNRLFSVQAVNVFKNVFTQIVFAIIFLFFVKEFLFTRWFMVFYAFFLFSSILLKDFLLRTIIYNLRKKKNNFRNMAIIGSGDTAVRFREYLEMNNNIGYKLKDVLDEEHFLKSEIDDQNNGLENYLLEEKIDDLILSLPLNKFHLAEDIIKICDRNAIQSYIVPDDFKFLSNKFRISLFGDIPVITTRSNPLEEIQWRMIKRIFDFTFSLIVFILFLWWLLPLIALIIRIDSKGKALFVQKRIGKENNIFDTFKFRTMLIPDEITKPVSNEDDRLTGAGVFLRKYNLDELPQFINVLKGDMSLVGPRPHAIPFDNSYSGIVEEIKLRHRVKPGITGWAQIHGLRGDVFDFEQNKIRTRKRIQYDIWYIENWTFWLDIQIIFRTVWQILRGKNLGV